VWGANIGRSKSSPFRIEPDLGKVSEDIGKAQSEVTADVFQDCVSGSYCANGVKDVWPKVSDIVFAFPISCGAKWLAGIPACDYVNRLNISPVDGGDVAKVGDPWVMVREDLAGSWFNLCIPSKIPTNGKVETAVPCEQAADSHATRPKVFLEMA
jgi:hypothetical protein